MLRNWSCSWTVLALACVAVTANPGTAAAQTTPDDIGRELASLRRELQALRAEVELLKAARAVPVVTSPETAAPTDGAQAPALPAPLTPDPQDQPAVADVSAQVLAQQIAELSQVKVESGSRLPLRLFGTLHATAFFNSGEANWLDNPNIVAVPPAAAREGTFSLGMRQTRVGLAVHGPTLGSFRTSGKVVADFFGGVPGFQTGQVMALPRLLVGFARLETSRTAIQIGAGSCRAGATRSHVACRVRFSVAVPVGEPVPAGAAGAGRAGPGRQACERAGALVAPIGGDFPGEDYRFVPPALPGERVARPAFEDVWPSIRRRM